MKKINWGIIGLGEIAQKFSEGFKETTNARLLAISSKDSKKLEKFKKNFLIEEKFAFKNYEDLIFCQDVDIIYIALPNSLHHFWVIKCIENNKNILVEKPATIKISEMEDIDNKLLSKKIFFAEAYMYRHHPQIKILIDILKNEKLGNLISIESSFGKNLLTKKKLFFFNKKKKIDLQNRLFNKKLGGGCILDLGCYTTSFSLFIFSLMYELSYKNFKIKNISREMGESGVDVNSKAELEYKNGLNSTIKASFKEDIGNKSVITGDKGSVILNDTWFGNLNIIKIINKKSKEIESKQVRNIYSYQIENISKNIINGLTDSIFPACNIKESVLNSKIIHNWLND